MPLHFLVLSLEDHFARFRLTLLLRCDFYTANTLLMMIRIPAACQIVQRIVLLLIPIIDPIAVGLLRDLLLARQYTT